MLVGRGYLMTEGDPFDNTFAGGQGTKRAGPRVLGKDGLYPVQSKLRGRALD